MSMRKVATCAAAVSVLCAAPVLAASSTARSSAQVGGPPITQDACKAKGGKVGPRTDGKIYCSYTSSAGANYSATFFRAQIIENVTSNNDAHLGSNICQNPQDLGCGY